MDAKEKLDLITAALAQGKAVFICTRTRAWKITPKNHKSWEESGRALFKIAGNSLYMARGKKYDCIDFCGIKVA